MDETTLQYMSRMAASFQCATTGRTYLMTACKDGRDDVVKALLEGGADVNAHDEDEDRAMFYACHKGHAECVRTLLSYGASCGTVSSICKPPLFVAVEGGHAECVRLFLEAQVDPDGSYLGITLLNVAAEHDDLQIANLLLDAGASPDGSGRVRPIQSACLHGHVGMVTALLQAGAGMNLAASCKLALKHGHKDVAMLLIAHDHRTGDLLSAARYGFDDVVRSLVVQRADVDAAGRHGLRPLHAAAEHGHEECLRTLLDANARLDAVSFGGQTALMKACQRGHEKCARALIDAGADMDIVTLGGITALVMASSYGWTECVRVLVVAGASCGAPVDGGLTALFAAAAEGHAVCVEVLIGARLIDLNATYVGDNTSLMIACQNGHLSCARTLVAAGADPNVRSFVDGTALTLAVLHGHCECVECLVKAAAAVDMTAHGGATALVYAASRCAHCVSMLLEAGATTARDRALHIACDTGKVASVRLLLDSGVDVNAGDENLLYLKTACARGHVQIARLLVEKGACPVVHRLHDTGGQPGGTMGWSPESLEMLTPIGARRVRIQYLLGRLRTTRRLRAYAFHWMGDVVGRLHAPGGRKRRLDYDHYAREFE